MSLVKSNIIGQGGYGCVSRPPLKCKDVKDKDGKNVVFNYENKVSKLLLNEHANAEMYEYGKIIKNKGITQFIVPPPRACRPEITEILDKTVEECKVEGMYENYFGTEYKLPNKSSVTSLLFHDGGEDLSHFNQLVYDNRDSDNIDYLITFFKSLVNLIKGLKFFKDNTIIHNDIKLENMVFNKKDGISRFIDFGVSTTFKQMIRESVRNENDMANEVLYGKSEFKEFYPPEYICLNYEDYSTSPECVNIIEDLYKFREEDKDDEKLVAYSNNRIKEFIDPVNGYEKFVTESVARIDIFQFSLSIKVILEYIKNVYWKIDKISRSLTKQFIISFDTLLDSYVEKNLLYRKTDPKTLLNEYLNILNIYTSEMIKQNSSINNIKDDIKGGMSKKRRKTRKKNNRKNKRKSKRT